MYSHFSILKTIFSCVLIFAAAPKKLPDNFQTCRHPQPNMNQCLKEAVQSALVQLKNGIPEVALPELEPLKLPNLTVSGLRYVLSFSDILIYNIYNAEVDEVDSNITPDIFRANINFTAPNLTSSSGYSVNGQLLLFSVDGGGKAVVTFEGNTFVQLTMEGNAVNVGGAEHYMLNKYEVKLFPKLVTFQLEDIIRGQKQITDEVNKVINENWDVVFGEIKPPLEAVINGHLLKYANHILKYVPV